MHSQFGALRRRLGASISSLTLKPDDFRLRLKKRSAEDRNIGLQKAAELSEPTANASATQLTSGHGTPLLVLHGSNMGAAQQVAARLAEEGESVGFVVTTGVLDDYTDALPSDGVTLFVTASYNGTPTDDAKKFIAWLESSDQDLSHVRYAYLAWVIVIGLQHISVYQY